MANSQCLVNACPDNQKHNIGNVAHPDWMTCHFLHLKTHQTTKTGKTVSHLIIPGNCSHPVQPTHPFHMLARIKLLLWLKRFKHKECIVKYSEEGGKVARAVETEPILT